MYSWCATQAVFLHREKGQKRAINDQKWSQMVQNGQKWPKRGYKWTTNDQNRYIKVSKMPKMARNDQNGPKRPKLTKKEGQKLVKMVTTGHK